MCQVEAAIQSVEKLLKDYGHPPLPRKVFFIFFIVPRSYHVQSWFCLDLHEVTLAFSKKKTFGSLCKLEEEADIC